LVECAVTYCRASFTNGIEVQRELAVGRVELAFSVAVHGECSGGRVSLAAIVCAGGVQQKRCYANGRNVVCGVEVKCSSADCGIIAAATSAKKRIPTNSGIRDTTGEALKCLTSFGCRGIGITSVWRRIDRWSLWRQRKAENEDENGDKFLNHGLDLHFV
jgi:hypothetical protein